MAEIVTNERGAKQSKLEHEWLDIDAQVWLDVARVSAEGKAKYGPDNWRYISQEDHINHALTHLFQYAAGDDSEEHLAHAACRILFAMGAKKEAEQE